MRKLAAAAVSALCLLLCGCDGAEPALAALEDARQQLAAAAGQAGNELAAAAQKAVSGLLAGQEPGSTPEQAADDTPEQTPPPQEADDAPEQTPPAQEAAGLPQQSAESAPAESAGEGQAPQSQTPGPTPAPAADAPEEDGSDTIRLDVQNILQNPELPNGCEITAATIVLNYLGFPVDKVTMASQYLPQQAEYWATDPDVAFMGNPAYLLAYYCNAGPVAEAVNAYLEDQGADYRAVDISGSPAEELYEWVEQGVPVIVWTTHGCTAPTYSTNFMMADGSLPYSNSHCVVLTGYDSEGCYVADPMYEFSYASYEVFNWCYEARGSYAVVIVEQ